MSETFKIFAMVFLGGCAFCMYAKGQNEKNRVAAIEAVKVAEARAKAKDKAEAKARKKAGMDRTINCRQAKAMYAKVDADPYLEWHSSYGSTQLKDTVTVVKVVRSVFYNDDRMDIVFKCAGKQFRVTVCSMLWSAKGYRKHRKPYDNLIKYRKSAKTYTQRRTLGLADTFFTFAKKNRKLRHIKKGDRIKVETWIGVSPSNVGHPSRLVGMLRIGSPGSVSKPLTINGTIISPMYSTSSRAWEQYP